MRLLNVALAIIVLGLLSSSASFAQEARQKRIKSKLERLVQLGKIHKTRDPKSYKDFWRDKTRIQELAKEIEGGIQRGDDFVIEGILEVSNTGVGIWGWGHTSENKELNAYDLLAKIDTPWALATAFRERDKAEEEGQFSGERSAAFWRGIGGFQSGAGVAILVSFVADPSSPPQDRSNARVGLMKVDRVDFVLNQILRVAKKKKSRKTPGYWVVSVLDLLGERAKEDPVYLEKLLKERKTVTAIFEAAGLKVEFEKFFSYLYEKKESGSTGEFKGSRESKGACRSIVAELMKKIARLYAATHATKVAIAKVEADIQKQLDTLGGCNGKVNRMETTTEVKRIREKAQPAVDRQGSSLGGLNAEKSDY